MVAGGRPCIRTVCKGSFVHEEMCTTIRKMENDFDIEANDMDMYLIKMRKVESL